MKWRIGFFLASLVLAAIDIRYAVRGDHIFSTLDAYTSCIYLLGLNILLYLATAERH